MSPRTKRTARKCTPPLIPVLTPTVYLNPDGTVKRDPKKDRKDRIEAIQDQMRQTSNLITLAFMDMEIVRQKLDLASSLMHQMKNIVRDMYDEEFKSDVEEILYNLFLIFLITSTLISKISYRPIKRALREILKTFNKKL